MENELTEIQRTIISQKITVTISESHEKSTYVYFLKRDNPQSKREDIIFLYVKCRYLIKQNF